MFRSGLREYPALAEYLKTADRAAAYKPTPVLWVAIGATIFLPTVIERFAAQEVVGASYLLLLVGLWIGAFVRKKKPLVPREVLRMEAGKTRKDMSLCLERSRLHRDLGEPTIEVLEACSQSWAQIHHALGTQFWASPDLPAHYGSLRAQSLEAADLAMDETVLLFRHALPENPRSPDVKGYVGEIIQEAVFGGSKTAAHLPPGFQQARATADKLAQLADHVTSITQQAEEELGVGRPLGAEGALDLCIGELKNLQQAESELRQNLGGK